METNIVKSSITITRSTAWAARFLKAKIHIDDEQVGSIGRGKSITLSVEPGKHSLDIDVSGYWGNNPLIFEIKPNENFEFLCDVSFFRTMFLFGFKGILLYKL